MDHQRQPELARQRDLRAENALGDVARRVVVVIVQPGLADADAFAMGGEAADRRRVRLGLLGRLMRMRADGEIDVGEPLGQRLIDGAARDSGRDRHHALDARRARARDDGVEFFGEIGKIEMAMAVDEGHGDLSREAGQGRLPRFSSPSSAPLLAQARHARQVGAPSSGRR